MFTYLDELDTLVDTLHEITFDNIPSLEDETLTYEEKTDIVNTIIQLMFDYTCQNPEKIHCPSFHEEMMEAVEDLIDETNVENPGSSIVNENVEDNSLTEIVDHAIDMFYIQVMPKRSYNTNYMTTDTAQVMFPCNDDKRAISTTLRHLKEIPQPEQRTMEWHTYRHNFITASNASKAIETECTRNQIIFEKCKPITMDTVMPNLTGIPISNYPKLDIVKFAKTSEELEIIQSRIFLAVNINTPMHWGQRYEAVSTMYYEMLHNVKIGEYGCIPHQKHNFLGASPDGIVETRDSHLYGRMLEIKNIVNRDITGIPLKPYWVQMQLQMEVCGLDNCDFLETRFIEYENKEEFEEDGTFLETKPLDNNTKSSYLKGITLFFINKDNLPEYEHKPLDMAEPEYKNKWFPTTIQTHRDRGHYLVHTYYWKLKEISCVLVLRNNLWFELNLPTFAETWNTILKERNTGYAHRAPKKRPQQENATGCLIQLEPENEPINKINKINNKTIPEIFAELDENSDNDSKSSNSDIIELSAPSPSPPQPPQQNVVTGSPALVMHIRTESMDETHI
jgi:hypothetical protein